LIYINLPCSNTRKMKAVFEEIIESFIQNKVGISNDFFSVKLAALLQAQILKLDYEGLMLAAGTGNNSGLNHDKRTRSDKIYWLDKKSGDTEELGFLDLVEDFIDYLNNTCYTGINAYEFHYALYEEGSFYKRHKDQFRTDGNRKYSLIGYLNDNWVEADGGQLWVHHDDSIQKIIPANRKAVFFDSGLLEHEVTTSMRPRMSVTGWLKRT